MESGNWRPNPPVAEPTMETADWRTQFQPNSRQEIVNKMEWLSIHNTQEVSQPGKNSSSTVPVLEQNTQASLDSTAQSGHASGGDWQEEVYQKIKVMKEMYLPELNEIYQKIAAKLQQHDSLPQPPKLEQLDKLKIFKVFLERLMSFLQVSKNDITPTHKEKLSSYEKQIVNFISANRPRNPTMQQGQLPPPHMYTTQQ